MPDRHISVTGSKKPSLMAEMFMSPSRPFYQSVITMGLNPISEDKYAAFAERLFAERGKKLNRDVTHEVYSRFGGITFCLQRVMNVLFMTTEKGKECGTDMIDDAVNYILDLSSEHYEMLYSMLSEKQRAVLLAIATERRATAVTSGQFVRKYHLQSVSSVNSAVKGLLEKDFITKDADEYCVYDHFLQLWLQKQKYIR